jgi:5'-nucleotidase
MVRERRLILVANDDGVDSPGLAAAARAVWGLGELMVTAPCDQWSGAGRSFPRSATGVVDRRPMKIDGQQVEVYCVDAAPAQVVLHAVLELTPRRPDLLVVGINYGENLGTDVTISGTVGAALQGATFGIPALAVSLQTPKETHAEPSPEIDFRAAEHFARYFADRMLTVSLPFDVDVLKVDIPAGATPHTPWRLTRVSRHVYFRAIPAVRDDLSLPGSMDYDALRDPTGVEKDSDIYALMVDRCVSVSPLSIDLTSRADLGAVREVLAGGRAPDARSGAG